VGRKERRDAQTYSQNKTKKSLLVSITHESLSVLLAGAYFYSHILFLMTLWYGSFGGLVEGSLSKVEIVIKYKARLQVLHSLS